MESRKKRNPANPLKDHPLASKAKLRARGPAQERRRKERTEDSLTTRITLHLPGSLVERLRNAVYWTPGLTLTALASEALRRLIDELERDRGDEFPRRDQKLRTGRPVK
jgi:hypothetical protein